MKKDMPLEGLRWSRDSGSALYDTPQNGRSRTGWGGKLGSFCLFRGTSDGIAGDGGRKGESPFLPHPAPLRPFAPRSQRFHRWSSKKKGEKNLVISE